MNKEDAQNVCDRINTEGFHYAFVHYSTFPEVKDERFHELRKNYLKSIEEMKKYLGESL